VRKMKALSVKINTVILIGKGRQNLICSVYSGHEINSKIFFLSRCFIFVGSSQIRVILHLGKYGTSFSRLAEQLLVPQVTFSLILLFVLVAPQFFMSFGLLNNSLPCFSIHLLSTTAL